MARPAKGPELVEGLSGSEEARVRLKVILETVSGKRSIEEAQQELGLSSSRFHELREKVLQAAMASLEPQPRGRPKKEPDAEALQVELEQLTQEYKRLLTELKIANVREELRLVMPEVLEEEPLEEETLKKKLQQARNRRKRQRRRQK